jgi:hypothetical protein
MQVLEREVDHLVALHPPPVDKVEPLEMNHLRPRQWMASQTWGFSGRRPCATSVASGLTKIHVCPFISNGKRTNRSPWTSHCILVAVRRTLPSKC